MVHVHLGIRGCPPVVVTRMRYSTRLSAALRYNALRISGCMEQQYILAQGVPAGTTDA